jgi:hypothetical protein
MDSCGQVLKTFIGADEEHGENEYSHGGKVIKLNLKNKPVITRPVHSQSNKLTCTITCYTLCLVSVHHCQLPCVQPFQF